MLLRTKITRLLARDRIKKGNDSSDVHACTVHRAAHTPTPAAIIVTQLPLIHSLLFLQLLFLLLFQYSHTFTQRIQHHNEF